MLKNKALRQRIEKLLVALPHCRDDDQKLIANVWQHEAIELVSKTKYTELKAVELLGYIAQGKLSNPESIRRMRQKIQEQQPILRGETYMKRQKHQGEVKKEIRAFS
jgi:hypothetical protein